MHRPLQRPQVTAPVFQDLPRLPTPLGNFLYTSPYFTRLPLADRLTALPLVASLLEHDADEASYKAYDAMSAYELFKGAGVSSRLYAEFLEPMLLVTLVSALRVTSTEFWVAISRKEKA